MLSKINLACAAALTILPHLAYAADTTNWSIETFAQDNTTVALADSLPTASLESICRDAQSAALPESKAAAYKSCVNDERAAFDQLRQKWARYSPKARATCAEPGDGAPISYVELETCLDMQRGGSLTIQGRGPGASPSLDTMESPTPVAPMPGQTERSSTVSHRPAAPD